MKEIKRCEWAKGELDIKYHDEEWGKPEFDLPSHRIRYCS